MPALFHPTTEQLAVAWLSTLALPGVATTLPKLDAWPVYAGTIRGFVTVGIVGGATRDTALRAPVISVGTWAAVPGSDNPQWGAASQLAEIVAAATFPHEFVPIRFTQSVKYAPALVHTAKLVSEPRRVPDPDSSYAHFETEVMIVWSEVDG